MNTVEPGSRWEDKDKRETGRVLQVRSTDIRYAYCEDMRTERRTRILLAALVRRFRRVG